MSIFGQPNIDKLKTKRDIKGLIKALNYSKNENIRTEAVRALVNIGKPAITPLIQALKHKDIDIRSQAANVLGELKNEIAIEPLIQALRDNSKNVQKSISLALRNIGKHDPSHQKFSGCLESNRERMCPLLES